MSFSPFFPLRFFGNGDDGGTYFIKQVDRTSTMWWYAEHPDLRFAQVFRGRLISGDGADDRWEGRFVDLPKGLACGHGSLNADMQVIAAGPPIAAIIRQSRPFGPSGLRRLIPSLPPSPPRPVTRMSAGFVGTDRTNLTGVWLGDDNGTYYIRQVSATNEIAWVGEHPAAEVTSPNQPGRQWVNVFMGTRQAGTIEGEWADVPKGEVDQEGRLELEVINEQHIRVVEKTGGFGGNEFFRLDDIQLKLRWISLEIVDQQEWFFEADEPYFMALIVKMDGSTVDFDDLCSASADVQGFVAPMLGDNVGAGTILSARRLPAYTTGITPIPGAELDQMRTVFGIAVRGWEKDFSSPPWVQGRLENWRTSATTLLNHSLRSDGAVRMSRDTRTFHVVWTWENEDDTFGFDTVVFSMRDLLALIGAPPRELVFDLRGGDVHYRVRAEITVRGVRGNCAP